MSFNHLVKIDEVGSGCRAIFRCGCRLSTWCCAGAVRIRRAEGAILAREQYHQAARGREALQARPANPYRAHPCSLVARFDPNQITNAADDTLHCHSLACRRGAVQFWAVLGIGYWPSAHWHVYTCKLSSSGAANTVSALCRCTATRSRTSRTTGCATAAIPFLCPAAEMSAVETLHVACGALDVACYKGLCCCASDVLRSLCCVDFVRSDAAVCAMPCHRIASHWPCRRIGTHSPGRYVIATLPTLMTLDFSRITKLDRSRAASWQKIYSRKKEESPKK